MLATGRMAGMYAMPNECECDCDCECECDWNVRKVQVLERDAILRPGRILMPKYELTC